MEAIAPDALFLGFDSSTQSLKVTALDKSLRVVITDSVNFDADLPHYGTRGGAHFGPAGTGRVTAPAKMWLEAMDTLLSKLKASSFPFENVKAISGSGQQHGTVYWRKGARDRLRGLKPSSSLLDQLGDQLSVPDSPIWMDSSTGAQCQAIESALGGGLALARLSGSRAFERYSGPQIRQIAELDPDAYDDTERISLVSSFGASVLLGDFAPIDHSDGAGMNLMDLRHLKWAPQALEATAPGLAGRLGALTPGHAVIGPIHRCHVERFGFSPDCALVAWSGDNPCSLAGLALEEAGDVAISLGTSDTLFAVVRDPSPGLEGHVFPNPVDPTASSFMVMLVYKNGSLTRQEIRDKCSHGSWEEFEAALQRTPPLNGGHLGFYYSQPEILPPLTVGTHRFQMQEDGGVRALDSFTPDTEIRALVEGQLVAMRGHAERIGLQSPPKRIIATGGGSANRAGLQILADVFGCPVYTAPTTDSASLGAALRAAHGLACTLSEGAVSFSSLLRSLGKGEDSAIHLTQVATPAPQLWETYGKMVRLRMGLEQQLLQEQEQS